MNKTVTIALASLLAVSPVAGIAYAQDTMTGDTMSTGSITADKVNVVTIASLQADESGRSEGDRLELKAKDAAALAATQAELQSDPGLVQALASKNVQLENVVEIQTAADGGKVVYVK